MEPNPTKRQLAKELLTRTPLGAVLLVSLLLNGVYFAVACGSNPYRTAVKTAARLQTKSADAFEGAVKEERAAILKCKAKAAIDGTILPPSTDPAGFMVACATLGAPLPYDPVLLSKLDVPINALYESTHIANKALEAKSGNLTALLLDVSGHLIQLARDIGILGDKAPPPSAFTAARQGIDDVAGGSR